MIALLLVVSMLAVSPAKKPVPVRWELTYTCESGMTSTCDAEEPPQEDNADGQRSFRTRQAAIDWIQEHYIFRPIALVHGAHLEVCSSEYLNLDSLDEIVRYQKIVTCKPSRGVTIVGANSGTRFD